MKKLDNLGEFRFIDRIRTDRPRWRQGSRLTCRKEGMTKWPVISGWREITDVDGVSSCPLGGTGKKGRDRMGERWEIRERE